MGFEIFKDIFKRGNKVQRPDYPAHIVCPNDPGIILSSEFGAAAMIREDSIRLVHITGQHCEAIPLLQNIERSEFFHELPNMMRWMVADNFDTEMYARGVNALAYEEKMVFDAILHRYDEVTTLLKSASIERQSYCPILKTAFQNSHNTQMRDAIWHTDAQSVVSICLDGSGTEFLEGALTQQEIARIQIDQTLPDHVKVRQSNPGDVLIMRGWWSCRQKFPRMSDDECKSTAIFHRAGSRENRRTVMFCTIN